MSWAQPLVTLEGTLQHTKTFGPISCSQLCGNSLHMAASCSSAVMLENYEDYKEPCLNFRQDEKDLYRDQCQKGSFLIAIRNDLLI